SHQICVEACNRALHWISPPPLTAEPPHAGEAERDSYCVQVEVEREHKAEIDRENKASIDAVTELRWRLVVM
ncbi:hypothetical protein L195_g057945, partial [Trifolium pratense]